MLKANNAIIIETFSNNRSPINTFKASIKIVFQLACALSRSRAPQKQPEKAVRWSPARADDFPHSPGLLRGAP